MVKSFSYILRKKSISRKIDEGHFLIYVEKCKQTSPKHYSEFVYLLARDRLLKLHVQYGRGYVQSKFPDYIVFDNLNLRNHMMYAKVLKKGKPTTRQFNFVDYVISQEKKLRKPCNIVPFTSIGIF